MPTPPLSIEVIEQTIALIAQCAREGFSLDGLPSAREEAARRLGISSGSVAGRLRTAENIHRINWRARLAETAAVTRKGSPPPLEEPEADDIAASVRGILVKGPRSVSSMASMVHVSPERIEQALDELTETGFLFARHGDRLEIPKRPQAAYVGGAAIQIVSEKDNTFTFGACGDQHMGSKYFRQDVLDDLYRRYADEGVKAVFNTGNWIDGEARFNTYDLDVHGLDAQARFLAENYPRKPGLTTYAIWGDDHEGWYAQREGVDVGAYVQGILANAGRQDWINLGFMESHIELVNANSGAKAVMAVVHPGGGSAYALSYAVQKIVESYEGGEKPACALFGHYHKLEAALVRNVWCLQTGTTQDQTPFMRKKRLEAHVGGTMVKAEQDPRTGAIIGFTPSIWRYFNRAYYGPANNRWSKHGPVTPMPRSIGGL